MSKGSLNVSLKGADDIFSTEESRQEQQREQVQQIPIGELFPFKDHPFKVLDDESMQRTVESVEQYGVLSPLIARPRPEGGYEIISGHRRQHAAQLAGLDALPVIVRNMDDDAAVLLMVDSNLQRENILPSERAFAYKMKLEAIKNQGARSDLTSGQIVQKSKLSIERVAEDAGEGYKTVQRFIRLTNLIPELLDMVDEKKIAFNPAVELSYLDTNQQRDFLEAMNDTQNAPSLSQAQRLKKLAQEGHFSYDVAFAVMGEEKKDELDKLDRQNAPMIAGGITPRQTKFETNKEKLRQTIRAALSAAASFEDFSSLLLREGVTVKESRGRLSYLTPDRTKPISARKLGDDFDRAAVLAVLEQNAARAAEKAAAISSTPPSIQDQLRADRAARTAPNVQRLVDIEQKKAEGKGRGYERWATMHNLKQMAATLNVYQEYGFTSPEQLEAAVDTAYQEMRQTSGELKALETKLQGKKELQRQVLAYAKTKPVRDGLKAQKSPKAREAYRQAHESDFIIADAAARYFKAHGITRLPARKALQDEIEQLVSKKSGLYNTYHAQKQRFKELQTVKRNIDQILRREEPRRRKEQSHER